MLSTHRNLGSAGLYVFDFLSLLQCRPVDTLKDCELACNPTVAHSSPKTYIYNFFFQNESLLWTMCEAAMRKTLRVSGALLCSCGCLPESALNVSEILTTKKNLILTH